MPARSRFVPWLLLVLVSLLFACRHLEVHEPTALEQGAFATWVVRTSLTSPEGVEQIGVDARRAGLNLLVAQVRGRGDAYYQSELEPRPKALQGSAFDPLAALLTDTRAAGLEVHAWMNANLVGAPVPASEGPRHVAQQHPEWLMWPEELARELLQRDSRDPAVVQRLLEHAEAHKDRVEGLYGDPLNPEWRAHVARVCADVARRYDVDGIHLDYIRYPGKEWGYSRTALALFREDVDREVGPEERAENERRVAVDPLAYTRRYPGRWTAFRRSAVTAMVAEIRAAVRAAASEPQDGFQRRGCALSAAVFADQEIARDRVLQDWPEWLRAGLLDFACIMNYTTDRAAFERHARAAGTLAGPVIVGIGSWRLEPPEILDRIAWVAAEGFPGTILFSHGDLQGRSEVFDLLRATPFARPAKADTGSGSGGQP